MVMPSSPTLGLSTSILFLNASGRSEYSHSVGLEPVYETLKDDSLPGSSENFKSTSSVNLNGVSSAGVGSDSL